MERTQVKKREKIAKVLNIIFNSIFIPLIIFASIFTLSIVINKIQTGVPSVFGYTQIQILSGSMQDAGFHIGDECFVKSENASNLKEGDFIAFFQFADLNCSTPDKVTKDNNPQSKAGSSKIVFHQIIKVETDINGNKWFSTKGTNNESPDSIKIYQNYVIGKYVEKENFWTNFISFITSSYGMLCLVVIPCTLIIAVDIYQLIIVCYEYKKEISKKEQA